MPTISVIIPIYNSSNYIAACLQSLQRQTFADFEAICVDDASTDDSLAIAKSTTEGDTRFLFLQQEINQGPSAARNRALDIAQGTYIVFLDSDDQFIPTALEQLYTLAEQENLDLIIYNATSLYESEDIHARWHETIAERTPTKGIIRGEDIIVGYQANHEYNCALCTHFFRQTLLDDGPLRLLEGAIHEDELFAPLLYARAQHARLISDELYLRTVHKGSLVTAPRGIQNVSSLFWVTKKLEEWLGEHEKDYSSSFVDALCLRIWELRKIMADDILQCTGEELIAFQQSLPAAEAINFNINGIQFATEKQNLTSSRSWRLANTISHIAQKVRTIARK